MSSNPDFDRWYAAKSAKFLIEPTHRLETFGNTLVNYHLVSEIADRPGKIRVREGRLEAHQPLVIRPDVPEIETEGFSDAAQQYVEFLKSSVEALRIVRYGCQLKSDNYNEYVVTGSLGAVSKQVKDEVMAADDGFSAVIVGVDEPWDVALVELWAREVRRSADGNIRDLRGQGKFL